MRAYKTGMLIASALLLIGIINFTSNSNPQLSLDNNCYQKNNIENAPINTCLKVEESSSWFSWLTGESRSAQFHYLDLLELLTRSEEAKKTPSIKPLF